MSSNLLLKSVIVSILWAVLLAVFEYIPFQMGGDLKEARHEAVRQLATADSIPALHAAAGMRGDVYIYRDKSWLAMWFEWYEIEQRPDLDRYESVARDSEGEWFQCSTKVGPFYQLPHLDPQMDQWIAAAKLDAKIGDPNAISQLRVYEVQRVIFTLTTGPNLATARAAILTAGYSRFYPTLTGPLPNVVVTDADITAPSPPTTQEAAEQKLTDDLTLLGGFVHQERGETVAGADDWIIFDDRSLAMLEHWPGIVKADFTGCDKITDAGLHHLLALHHLRELTLTSNVIDDAGLAEIGALPRLQKLVLRNPRITDAGFINLRRLKSLTELNLELEDNPNVTGIGLSALSNLPELHTLGLSESNVTDDGLAGLEELTGLRELDLGNMRLTDEGIKHLRKLVNLESLELRGDRNITDAAMPAIDNLKNLRHLSLNLTQVSSGAIKKFYERHPGVDVQH